jgi:hypothetical protein
MNLRRNSPEKMETYTTQECQEFYDQIRSLSRSHSKAEVAQKLGFFDAEVFAEQLDEVCEILQLRRPKFGRRILKGPDPEYCITASTKPTITGQPRMPLPMEILRHLNVGPGDQLHFAFEDDGGVVLTKA